MLDLETIRRLGRAWFGRYLSADWMPRSSAQSQRLLTSLGLTGAFWKLSPSLT